jgi:hypothetical protein
MKYIHEYAKFTNRIMGVLTRFSVREQMACCLISDAAHCLIDFTMHADGIDKQEPFRR